jgi:hypothetical protein
MSNSVDKCDLCGLGGTERKVNEYESKQPFECIACKRELQIPLASFECDELLNELEQLRTDIYENILKEFENIKLVTDGIQLLKKLNDNKNQQDAIMVNEKDYLNIYHVTINAKIIRHCLQLFKGSTRKAFKLISYNQYYRQKSLLNVDKIDDKNKSFLDEKLEKFKLNNPKASIDELKSCLIELNRAKCHILKHELRMRKLIEFVPSDDIKRVGKFRIHHTELLIDESGYYEGEVRNGMSHGYGRQTNYDDGYIYEGYFDQGDFHGHGTFSWFNGTKYVGEMNRNRMTGKGSCYIDCVKTYEGEFYEAEPCGLGIRYDMGDDPVKGIWYYGRLVKKIFD